MTRIVQHRRGTSSGLSTILGAPGELFVDTSLVTVVVHDGVTTGGVTLARNADVQTLSSTTATNLATVSSNAFIAATTRGTNTSFGIVRGSTTSINISNGVVSLGSSITTNWTIQETAAGALYFYYNGVAKFRFDSSGTIAAVSNIGAFITI
jgi:Major tropism determinant N-terminal domain